MSSTPTRKAMCASCPFRDDAPEWARALRPMLEASALTESSRECHRTGKAAAEGIDGKGPKPGIPALLCRGARDRQLALFHALGVVSAPTDEAWDDACRRRGLPTPADRKRRKR